MEVHTFEGRRTRKASRDILYVETVTDCWECVSHKAKTRDGYTSVRHEGKLRRLPGLSYELYYNERVDKPFVIRHKCDNPACFNPRHLEKGTQKDNVADMMNRGRAFNKSGENNPRAKLSNRDVYEIKHLLAYTSYYYREIGSWYGVDKSQIYMIAKGKRFTNIAMEGKYL